MTHRRQATTALNQTKAELAFLEEEQQRLSPPKDVKNPKREANNGGLFAIFVDEDDDDDDVNSRRNITTNSPSNNSPTADSQIVSKYSADMFTEFIEQGRRQANETLRRKVNARIEETTRIITEKNRETQRNQKMLESEIGESPYQNNDSFTFVSAKGANLLKLNQMDNAKEMRYVATYCEIEKREKEFELQQSLQRRDQIGSTTDHRSKNDNSPRTSSTTPSQHHVPASSPFSRQFGGDTFETKKATNTTFVTFSSTPTPTTKYHLNMSQFDAAANNSKISTRPASASHKNSNNNNKVDDDDEEAAVLAQMLPRRLIKKAFEDAPSASRNRRKEEKEQREHDREHQTNDTFSSPFLFPAIASSESHLNADGDENKRKTVDVNELSLTTPPVNDMTLPRSLRVKNNQVETFFGDDEVAKNINESAINNKDNSKSDKSKVELPKSSLHGMSAVSTSLSHTSRTKQVHILKNQKNDVGDDDDEDQAQKENEKAKNSDRSSSSSPSRRLEAGSNNLGSGSLRQARAQRSANIIASEQHKKVVGWRYADDSRLFSDPRTCQKIVGFNGMASDESGFDAAVAALTNEANVVQKEGRRQRWWAQQRQNALEKQFRDRVVAAVQKGESAMNETMASREALESLAPTALNEAHIATLAFAEGRARWVVEAGERFVWNELLVEFYE